MLCKTLGSDCYPHLFCSLPLSLSRSAVDRLAALLQAPTTVHARVNALVPDAPTERRLPSTLTPRTDARKFKGRDIPMSFEGIKECAR